MMTVNRIDFDVSGAKQLLSMLASENWSCACKQAIALGIYLCERAYPIDCQPAVRCMAMNAISGQLSELESADVRSL